MVIGTAYKTRKTSCLRLTINGTVLENVHVHKLLGVYIDNNLKWHHHIDDVCKRVNSKINLLKKVLYYLSDDMKHIFYNAYILPIMDYCCQIWGKGNTSHINKIYSLQKRIAKIVLRKPKRSSSLGLLKDLKWLTFTDRCKYQTAVLVYKIRNHMTPSYMANPEYLIQIDACRTLPGPVSNTKPGMNLRNALIHLLSPETPKIDAKADIEPRQACWKKV